MPAQPVPPFDQLQFGLLGLESNEEEDPATRDSPPDAPPRGFNTGRRKQVMSAPVELHAGWTPPVFEKTRSEKERLRQILSENVLIKGQSDAEIGIILDAFQGLEFASGTRIITEGDEGDMFYVLESGACDITVRGRLAMQVTPGGSFGELALLYGSPRAATVTATTDVRVWALDRSTFKQILVGTTVRRNAAYEAFLDQVPVLQSLGRYEKLKLTDALRTQAVRAGEAVIREGTFGNDFYIIESGEVCCTQTQPNGEQIEVCRRLVAADFFGEQALLYTEKRAATVVAVCPTSLLVLDRETFLRLLGPLSDIIQREACQQQRR